jgi:hypothetical protein
MSAIGKRTYASVLKGVNKGVNKEKFEPNPKDLNEIFENHNYLPVGLATIYYELLTKYKFLPKNSLSIIDPTKKTVIICWEPWILVLPEHVRDKWSKEAIKMIKTEAMLSDYNMSILEKNGSLIRLEDGSCKLKDGVELE